MSQIAGFWYEVDQREREMPPLLLLRGSGQTENIWDDIGPRLAPRHPLVRARGNIIWEYGFAFFRRNIDRSLDLVDLARAVNELACLVGAVSCQFQGRKPILVGYSNGAIAAAALAREHPELTGGAILFRPLLAPPIAPHTALDSYPVLILSGADDSRRAPEDGDQLARHLSALGAEVEYHLLPCGHGWDPKGRDVALARRWLEARWRPA